MDKTKLAVDLFDRLADDYQHKYMDVSLYHDTFDLFCKIVTKENAAILDIACGPGNVTKYLLEKRPDFKILGVDLAPNMLHLAEINDPTAEFKLLDSREISTLHKNYDGIICGFGLPYLSKEEAVKLIADASDLLNANGVLYISTMEDDYDKSRFQKSSAGDELYMYFHQADYLKKALEENNFKLIHLQRKEHIKHDGTRDNDLILIAEK